MSSPVPLPKERSSAACGFRLTGILYRVSYTYANAISREKTTYTFLESREVLEWMAKMPALAGPIFR